MRTAAPGKLVLSGAYAVLEGAPALVCSVSAFAVADDARTTTRPSPELRAAFGTRSAPIVDTSAMRRGKEKLGLGSSAAAVVAAVALDVWAHARETARDPLRPAIAARAIRAHREAQGGGSGVDVLASTHGGFLVCRTTGGEPTIRHTTLPEGIEIEAFFLGRGASTAGLLGAVRRLRDVRPELHGALLEEATAGALDVEEALAHGRAGAFVAGLRRQQIALQALGRAASCDIVPASLRGLDDEARGHGALVATTGAGGGDVAIAVSVGPLPGELRGLLLQAGLAPLSLQLGVEGVRVLSSTRP